MYDVVVYFFEDYVGGLESSFYVCFWKDCFCNGLFFKVKYKFINYICVYMGEKFFLCLFFGCGKFFVRLENLKIYKWMYIGEKLFMCEYFGCDWCFVNLSDRKKYLYVYMFDKFYICKIEGCNKSYIYLSFFWKYMKFYVKFLDFFGLISFYDESVFFGRINLLVFYIVLIYLLMLEWFNCLLLI